MPFQEKRPVVFKNRWIPTEYEPDPFSKSAQRKREGTGTYSKEIEQGFFLTWGTDYIMENDRPAHFTVAIIEDANGSVHKIHLDDFTFIN